MHLNLFPFSRGLSDFAHSEDIQACRKLHTPIHPHPLPNAIWFRGCTQLGKPINIPVSN